ncbi:MAG: ATP-binding protein, partial [Ferruginibacter sp.]
KELDYMLKLYPIVALTGPRQSGKTTFLKTEFPKYKYVNLENPDNRNYALKDPNNFLNEHGKYVIFDEVQRVPHLFSYIQHLVDENKIMGQYIFSGSQNFHLMNNITQSLAGRVAILKLFPFDLEEMKTANWHNPKDFTYNMQRGFYPALYDRKIPSKIFYSNYIQTYIERDVTNLINIRDLKNFRNFLYLCASRAGQLLNLNSLAMECGITQPTAKAWISVLETSYIVFQLQPYFTNFSKRVTKTPKLYFYDTGLLCHLLKIKEPQNIATHPQKGALFENMMIAEIVKNNAHKNLLQELYFFRDAVGHEVDLLIQTDEKMALVEIKATQTIMTDMFKGLQYFETLKPNLVKSKSLIYAGFENQKRTAGKLVPWEIVCTNKW